MLSEGILKSSGSYKKLLTYQKSDIIYQITSYFCQHFFSRGDRTVDQMIQAARSGKQNIIEGSAAATTSSKTELHLTNVAKASLRELLEDYEDFLKTRRHAQWVPGSVEFEAIRKLGKKHNNAEYFLSLISTRPPYCHGL
jgi:DNA topoisomerase, type IA, zn finger domain protein